MTWLTTLHAPDLSHLPVLQTTYINFVVFNDVGGSDDPQARALAHSYFFAVDKALWSYSDGRALVLDYISSSNSSALLLHGIAHFETAVVTVKRCLRLIDKMPGLKDDLGATPAVFEAYASGLKNIRNVIEHIEDKIGTTGAASVPQITQDGKLLKIKDDSLSLTFLAEAIEHLHKFGVTVASRPHS